jgi:hypothetical protein
MDIVRKIIELFDVKSSVKLEAIELWEVRWRSRHGEFSGDVRPEMATFTSEKDARVFADSLRAAFRLVRHIGANNVSVSRRS